MATAEPTFAEQATHHVALMLDNDEGLYLQRGELVGDVLGGYSPAEAGNDRSVAQLADALKDWCEDLCGLGDREFDLSVELLTLALAWVDWRKLAADYIEEAQS